MTLASKGLLTMGMVLLGALPSRAAIVDREGVRFEVPDGCVHKAVDTFGRPDVTGVPGTLQCRRGHLTIHYDIGWRAGEYCTEGTGMDGTDWVVNLPPNQAGQKVRVCARRLGGKEDHFLVLSTREPSGANFFMTGFAPEDVVTLLEVGKSITVTRR